MSDKKKSSRSNLNFLFIVGLILAIVTVIFAIQNSDTTTVEFFSMEVNPPTALLIIGCIALGSVITLLFSIPGWFGRRKQKSRLQNEIKDIKKKYDELAAINPSTPTSTEVQAKEE